MNIFLSGSRFLNIVSYTVLQALLSTLLALVIGLSAAFFTARRNFPLKGFLLSLSSIPFCIPSLLVALGFVSFFGMNGTLNSFLMHISGAQKPPLTFLYSFAGVIICQGFYNFPLIMSTVNDSWQRLSTAEKDAARLLGASDFKIFRTITFYQLFPSIVSACIPVFLYCFFSFMIILMFGALGSTTMEVEIYQLARVNLDFNKALRYGAAETSIALSFVVLYTLLEQKTNSLRGVVFSKNYLNCKNIKGIELFFAFLLFSAIILFFLCPFFSIFINALASQRLKSNFTFYNFLSLFSSASFYKALKWTFITGILTAFFCTVTAFIYAILLKTYDSKGKKFILRVIPLVPMAISSVITGIIITLLIRSGNLLLLVLAQTLLYWPIAFRQIYSDLQKFPQSTQDAARILSKTPFDMLIKIYLPFCRPSLIRSLGFSFALSAGDATLPLVMAIPRFDSLALYTYRLAGRYKFNEACACGIILGILCIGVFTLSKKVKHT